MPRIIKNTLLEYLPQKIIQYTDFQKERVFLFKNSEIKDGEIIYLMEREMRLNDNPALEFAISESKKLNLPLKIITPCINFEHKPKEYFLKNLLVQIQKDFIKFGFDFIICDDIKTYLYQKNISILIIDFNPILNRNWLKKLSCKIIEIDGHNIIPARYVSNKQEYNASCIRRKIYQNISLFLTDKKDTFKPKTKAEEVLRNFIENKLPYYAEYKNNPNKNVLSGLSKYLNLGFISSQKVAIEVIKSNIEDINKEVFLDELIIRKELSENFCLYSKGFKTFESIPNWAKTTLSFHQNDIRNYTYSLKELENATTHDILWNATQIQLKKEGIIHGYLRMYWAKKILEWTLKPEMALKYAIYINDKYAYDSPSANGYANILWAIAGLHDRAFMDYSVTGKIRRMTYNSLKQKFKVDEYIRRYQA